MTAFDEAPLIDRLAWDKWNLEHIGKHSVTREQVEEVITSGEIVSLATRKQRFLLIGPTQERRLLAVVIGPVPNVPGVYYTFSARPASRQERRYYHHQREGDQL